MTPRTHQRIVELAVIAALLAAAVAPILLLLWSA